MTSPDTFESYCSQVCSFVRFRPDHDAIRAELTDHLLDRCEAILESRPGIPLAEARSRAIAAMGDPEQTGRALDAVHSPLLGWFQIWFRRAVRTLAVILAFLLLLQLGAVWTDLTAPVQSGMYVQLYDQSPENYDTVADFRPGTLLHTEDYTFTVERAIVTRYEESALSADSTVLSLHYTLKVSHRTPWLRGPDFREWLYAVDDLGNRYPSRGQQHLDQQSAGAGDSAGNPTAVYPFASYYDLWVSGIAAEAGAVTLRFDRYGENAILFTIPLRGGGDHA